MAALRGLRPRLARCGVVCILLAGSLRYLLKAQPEEVAPVQILAKSRSCFRSAPQEKLQLNIAYARVNLGRLVDLKAHNLDRSFDLNVRAFVLGAQRAVKLMKQGGRIAVLSSYGSIRAYPTYANLGSNKAAIEAWVRYMAVEVAPRGINVNAVNGGLYFLQFSYKW